MSDIKIIYLVLSYFYVISLIYSAFWIAKSASNSQYWKRAIVPIVIHTFVRGLRWARDQDYAGYFYHYSLMKDGQNPEEYEYLFYKVCDIFNNIGLPYWVFIFALSAFYIYSLLFLFKNFKEALPFIFIVMFFPFKELDNMIRFGFAFSFVLIALGFFFQSKYKQSMLFVFLGVNVHTMVVIYFPIILMAKYLNKKTLPKKCTIPAFILLTLFGTPIMLSFLVDWIITLNYSFFERGEFYAEHMADIINGTDDKFYTGSRGIVTSVRVIFAYLPLLIWGRDVLDYYVEKYSRYIYNMSVFACLSYPIFNLVELFDRLNTTTMIFVMITNGYVLYDYFRNKSNYPKYARCLIIFSMICCLYPMISAPFHRIKDNYMLFLWDANGRDIIPTNVYPMEE